VLPDFGQSLVLNQWLFGLFGLDSTDGCYALNGRRVPLLEAFKQRFQLNEHSEEGLDENRIHRFHHALVNQITGELPGITRDELLAFDQNIVSHTLALNEERLRRQQEPIVWKYFQYLALLFVEIYLDRFFRDPVQLARDLNAHIARYNADKEEAARLVLLDESPDARLGLNKLALWCATGSGKTLLMHVNLRQYRHHLAKHGQSKTLNRTLLLTPNEGLSRQHLGEFHTAGIEAELFDKNARGLFAGTAVEIIDIHKLAEDMGEKTVAVDAFEGHNLVLVDEGHRGATGGEEGKWLSRRDQLCEKGFSFEYSATFKQAVKGKSALIQRYARSIVFDYSYRYFYEDGYGKDYQILNLDDDTERSSRRRYLVACLLAAYQQRKVYDEHEKGLRPFNIEKPLWVFVGGSVNAVRTEAGRTVSDVTEILLFLADFIGDRGRSAKDLVTILQDGLVTATGNNLFANRFKYLVESGLHNDGDALFDDICARLFNAPGSGSLHVEYLKGADGELTIAVGDNEPFGVINVGDARKLADLCEATPGLVVQEREFSGSVFRRLNESGNPISLLIGSRKFTEGWNSWRVSTLGLMKIGQNEGAQIIQLFGRGVRLKGYEFSLKRSRALQIPGGLQAPKHIEVVETLNVFGIHADYMARFREYLQEEGLPTEGEREEFILPVIRNLGGLPKLKVIRLKPEINGVRTEFGTAFRQVAPVPQLAPPAGERDRWLRKNPVQLNWYPKIQALQARGKADVAGQIALDRGVIGLRHVAFLDIDRAWYELLRYKNERGWQNFNIPRSAVDLVLAESDWYQLWIPAAQLAFDDIGKVAVWQEIVEALLKKYAERYYNFRKREWEEPHLEYAELAPDDPNFPEPGERVAEDQGVYRIQVDRSEEQLIIQLRDLVKRFRADPQTAALPDFLRGAQSSVSFLRFGQHLYEPLISATGTTIQVKPVALNDGELRFVKDLKAYCETHQAAFASQPLYLLRNQSRGRGVGFFEAGNFYPDFILWRLDGATQRITFVDPKGVRNVPWGDPKLGFGATIKDIEQRLTDPAVKLASVIVSNTPRGDAMQQWGKSAEEIAQQGIVFQSDDNYILAILS
jgi:hypothetical protein